MSGNAPASRYTPARLARLDPRQVFGPERDTRLGGVRRVRRLDEPDVLDADGRRGIRRRGVGDRGIGHGGQVYDEDPTPMRTMARTASPMPTRWSRVTRSLSTAAARMTTVTTGYSADKTDATASDPAWTASK